MKFFIAGLVIGAAAMFGLALLHRYLEHLGWEREWARRAN